MSYLLTEQDRANVTAAARAVAPEERVHVVAVHERQLINNRRRLRHLQEEVASLERSIAMREAAVLLLNNLPGQKGSDDK